MANNITLNAATVGGGQTAASEDIGGLQFQRIKLALGASGQDTGDISSVNPLPVEIGGSSVSVFGDLITAENTPLLQVDFVYGINTQTGVTSVVTTGVAATDASRLRLQTGTGAAGAALYTTKRTAKYRPGQGMTVRFTTVYTTGAASSTQIHGVGTAENGYFFGFNGSSFGILHRNNSVDTWTLQGAWNGDKCDGSGYSLFTLIPTFGNVYQIRYPYLGYGNITFWIQDAGTGHWLRAHTIEYTNSSVSTELRNPNMTFYMQAVNSGNTSNLIMYSGSMAALLSGVLAYLGNPKWAYDNNKTGITAETSVFALKVATTYNGVTNRGSIRLNSVSVGCNATNAVAVLRFKIGATLAGTATYVPIDGATADDGVTITAGNSIVSVNTLHSTVTAATGQYFFNMSINGASNMTIDLGSLNLVVAPGEVLSLGVFSTASANASVSLNWSEDI